MTEENKGYLTLIIIAVVTIMVGASLTYVGYFTTIAIRSSADATLTPTAATGTFTFSGNSITGEFANVTYNSVVYPFRFNTTGSGCGGVADCIAVDLSGGNTAILSSTALTATVTDNATVAAFVTPTDDLAGVTTLTFVSTGITGNSVTLSDTGANITSSGLSGGVDGVSTWAAQTAMVNTSFTLIGIILMLIGVAGLISVLLKGLGGGIGGRT